MFSSIDCPVIYNLNSICDVQVVLFPISHKLFLPSQDSGALFATCTLGWTPDSRLYRHLFIGQAFRFQF